MEKYTLQRISEHLKHAREKHPVFCNNKEQAVSIAAEEFGEWAKEVNDKNDYKSKEECLDLIAVLIRYLEEVK